MNGVSMLMRVHQHRFYIFQLFNNKLYLIYEVKKTPPTGFELMTYRSKVDTFINCTAWLHIIDEDNRYEFIYATIIKEPPFFFHTQALQDITIRGERLLLPPRSRLDVMYPSVQPHQRTVHTVSNTNGLMESCVQYRVT